MKKCIFLTTLILMSCLTCRSYSDSDRLQSADRGRKSNTDIYRAKGYRGSVSITDQYVVWIGFDTSHGYMFNEHHYLGAGVGLFLAPTGFFPLFGHTFIEYNAYILKRASTPTAGIKVGFMGFLGEMAPGITLYSWYLQKSAELEPNIGWSWAFNEDMGIRLSLGAAIFILPQWEDILAMPKLTIAFDF